MMDGLRIFSIDTLLSTREWYRANVLDALTEPLRSLPFGMVMATAEIVAIYVDSKNGEDSADWPVITAGDLVPELAQIRNPIASDFDAFVNSCLESLALSKSGSAYWWKIDFPPYEGET
jgi:hypothetical protein